jgi:hypothetical protein
MAADATQSVSSAIADAGLGRCPCLLGDMGLAVVSLHGRCYGRAKPYWGAWEYRNRHPSRPVFRRKYVGQGHQLRPSYRLFGECDRSDARRGADPALRDAKCCIRIGRYHVDPRDAGLFHTVDAEPPSGRLAYGARTAAGTGNRRRSSPPYAPRARKGRPCTTPPTCCCMASRHA